MAQWKETLEPYIKVNERIRTTTIVPTAGEDLIIGATIISDSGPSYPVLITSQREFLNTFASQEITKNYIESLNDFYNDSTDTNSDVASTMWLNAYRLAGSTNMLIVRATKGADMNYVVSLDDGDLSRYIVRDGQLLKQINPGNGFSLTIDRLGGDASNRFETGWAISINEIGIIGNLVGDNGPVYEYFASDLRELVEYLNGTSKFFCPNPVFYVRTDNGWNEADENEKPDSVYFKEVYLAQNFIDTEGFKRFYEGNAAGLGSGNAGTAGDTYGTKLDGLAYLLATVGKQPEVSNSVISDAIIDLNTEDYSGGNYPNDGYLVNTFNSNSEIKIRIRRFNHDAVILRDDVKPTVVEGGNSPFEVIEDVIRQYKNTTDPVILKRIQERDFYEVAVLDPSLDKDPLSFCVGNYPGRGDLTLDELNDTLKMINIHVSSMEDLDLEYYSPSEASISVGNVPEGMPIPPKGYVWREVSNNDQDVQESLTGGAVAIIDQNTTIGSSDVTRGTIFAPSINYVSRTVYVKTTTDQGADAVYVPEGYKVSLDNNIYTIVLYERNGELRPYTTPIIPGTDDNVISIELTDLVYSQTYGKFFTIEQQAGVYLLTVVNPTVQLVNDGEVLESPDSSRVINPNSPIETSNSLFTTVDNSTESLTDAVRSIVEDEVDPHEVLVGGDNLGNIPVCAIKGNTAAGSSNGIGNRDASTGGQYYILARDNNSFEIYRDLSIKIDETDILTVTPGDLKRSISAITEDEVYTTEGLTDLGNTNIDFQTYLCNMAKNENYFYPISTLYSTNYLAIANYRSRLAQDSHKLYTSAPWDIDSGTVGFKFHASPSVIYWEAVSRNRSMNREFASVFGFSSNGQVLYTNPVTEFTKKQRQLLLSKQVNTVMWNSQNQTWNMNDCYTMTSENHILNEDGNSRLFIRINKAIPTLLRPLIGRKLNNATYADAETILKYWFERTILTMQYSVSDYKVTIANLEANDDQARRQNKMYVLVECLFARSLKYVIVYSDALDMGMEFVGEIV